MVSEAIYHLTRAVHQQRPDWMLQGGIAGIIDPHLSRGETVAVVSECLGDLGVEENGGFRSLFDLKLAQPDTVPWTGGRLVNSQAAAWGLPLARSVTINEISTRPERIAYYKDRLGAQIESMEGAALHYVGLREKIPFLQVRSLSNFAGERNKGRWRMAEAIAGLNLALEKMILKCKP